ncbi:MAG: efflux RND transporter permease subunit, partial [Lachnospiraceae bacterium]|nr:efflux RND transporter permease subunit [Lachnospiraceae bacterium]
MLSKLTIKRPVTTVMVLLIVCLCGIVALTGLKMDLMPSMDIPVAVVSTSYTGAGPEEIETMLTKPIEEVLGTVSNVDSISSVSSAGSSIVIVQFENGTDIDMASLDMREKIDLIKGYLPSGASEPMVLKIDMNSLSSIVVGVSSDMESHELTEFLDSKVVNRIERIEGVASVGMMGNEQREIQVVVNKERLEGYGITMNQIAT